jgi:hypothetical protein
MGVQNTKPKRPLKPPSLPKPSLKPPSLPKPSLKPPSIPKLSLKPLREFLPKDLRGTRGGGTSPNKLTEGIEAYDTDITDAASVIISSELNVSARKALSDSFVNDIKKCARAAV